MWTWGTCAWWGALLPCFLRWNWGCRTGRLGDDPTLGTVTRPKGLAANSPASSRPKPRLQSAHTQKPAPPLFISLLCPPDCLHSCPSRLCLQPCPPQTVPPVCPQNCAPTPLSPQLCPTPIRCPAAVLPPGCPPIGCPPAVLPPGCPPKLSPSCLPPPATLRHTWVLLGSGRGQPGTELKPAYSLTPRVTHGHVCQAL